MAMTEKLKPGYTYRCRNETNNAVVLAVDLDLPMGMQVIGYIVEREGTLHKHSPETWTNFGEYVSGGATALDLVWQL